MNVQIDARRTVPSLGLPQAKPGIIFVRVLVRTSPFVSAENGRALNSSGRARGGRALSSLESAAPRPKRVLSGRARRVPASSERASPWVAFYISALVIEVCGLSSWF